ncbi:hypothetical protein F5Y03DRAFT_360675 [Xylaria venustula]|nr:hypothetical protein F5Y03DRAFT_360675 [Xylaria venustula]
MLRLETTRGWRIAALLYLLGLGELNGIVLELLESIGAERVEVIVGEVVVHCDSKSQPRSRTGPLARACSAKCRLAFTDTRRVQ